MNHLRVDSRQLFMNTAKIQALEWRRFGVRLLELYMNSISAAQLSIEEKFPWDYIKKQVDKI